MQSIRKMLEEYLRVFREICFDYEEALKRLNVTQEDVDALREASKCSRSVPKIIHDKSVRIKKMI